jgi:hypothetical protein
VTSDAELLASRELDDAVGLSTMAGETLADLARGRTIPSRSRISASYSHLPAFKIESFEVEANSSLKYPPVGPALCSSIPTALLFRFDRAGACDVPAASCVLPVKNLPKSFFVRLVKRKLRRRGNGFGLEHRLVRQRRSFSRKVANWP